MFFNLDDFANGENRRCGRFRLIFLLLLVVFVFVVGVLAVQRLLLHLTCFCFMIFLRRRVLLCELLILLVLLLLLLLFFLLLLSQFARLSLLLLLLLLHSLLFLLLLFVVLLSFFLCNFQLLFCVLVVVPPRPLLSQFFPHAPRLLVVLHVPLVCGFVVVDEGCWVPEVLTVPVDVTSVSRARPVFSEPLVRLRVHLPSKFGVARLLLLRRGGELLRLRTSARGRTLLLGMGRLRCFFFFFFCSSCFRWMWMWM
mmetsp:Transcript_16321/g.41579  ORF Transcript_16321/g.41579 Transcript_16321/m.41579 type:complete len:254 (-) Transcript_16321:132-893(-)